MKTKFFLNGKKISKKEVIEREGLDRFNWMMEEAKECFMEDPEVENDFMARGGMLTIVFE